MVLNILLFSLKPRKWKMPLYKELATFSGAMTSTRFQNMKWQIFPFKGHLLNEPQTMFKIPPRQSDFSFHLSYMCSVIESCLTPCNPLDYSPPGSSVHGIFQAGILEWVVISSSRGSPDPGIISCVGRQILYYHLGSPTTCIYL